MHAHRSPRPRFEVHPEAIAVHRSRVSGVWLIPLVALAVAGWLAYRAYTEQGPKVTIELKTAAGLEAGKTRVKFKDVEVGSVTEIRLAPDLKTVLVNAQLTKDTQPYLSEHTRFWVERPRVTASRVSGLETLLSGAYIAMDPVAGGPEQTRFEGLEEPPLFTATEPGRKFQLRSRTLGSLNIGSPVYFRQIQVGQVVGNRLEGDNESVIVEIFVSNPYESLVHRGTRFWNASGVDFSLSAEGLKVDTVSLLSVLLGGISFDTPETFDGARETPAPDHIFWLYPNRAQANERVYPKKERYVLYFEGSARGLTNGAPVMVRGIPVGRALDVKLVFDAADYRLRIKVLIEVEPERVEVMGGPEGDDPEAVDRLVARGLRAQLRSASLVTGQLYVDLDFHPDAPAAAIGRDGDHRTLPTVAAPLDVVSSRAMEIMTRVDGILAKVDALPIERIGANLERAVSGADGLFAGAAELVEGPELQGAAAEMRAALAAVRAAAERLDGEIAPELARTLRETGDTLASAGDLLAESSPVYMELRRMLEETSAAARAVRGMAEYLERHPEALLQGKGGRR